MEVLEKDQSKSPTEEVVEDMLSIVTAFSVRLCGKHARKFRQKVRSAIQLSGVLTVSTQDHPNPLEG